MTPPLSWADWQALWRRRRSSRGRRRCRRIRYQSIGTLFRTTPDTFLACAASVLSASSTACRSVRAHSTTMMARSAHSTNGMLPGLDKIAGLSITTRSKCLLQSRKRLATTASWKSSVSDGTVDGSRAFMIVKVLSASCVIVFQNDAFPRKTSQSPGPVSWNARLADAL